MYLRVVQRVTFKSLKKHGVLQSIQGQAKGLDLSQALLRSIPKHNLQLHVRVVVPKTLYDVWSLQARAPVRSPE